ncbi:TonB-dependent receptor [Psychromonas sp.]|nr:TonB-dependent receptor [Psychromonas sp.]
MLIHRYTPLAFAIFSLCSAHTFANESEQDAQNNERKNILITKGYSAPNATMQNYSGDTVINIVPNNDDINKSLDQLIAENAPGFVHTNSGTSKHNSSNYHRGLSDEYTLYLLNGAPFPSTTLGSQNIPNIPMESIALVEVIRGAQASLYGSNSLTGVINIVTKTGETLDAQLNFSAGSDNTQRIGGVYANKFGKFRLMTSLDLDKSDGYDFIESSDDEFGYKSYSMNTYAAYVTETNRFSLALNNATTDLEINQSGKVDSYQDTVQLTGKYIQQFNSHFSSEFTLSTAEVDSTTEQYNSTNEDNYKTNETLVQLHLNTEWQKAAVNFGGEYIHSKFKSNENGDEREQTALFAAFSGEMTDFLNISGGLRNDHYSDFGNALTYSAGFSLFDTASLSYKTSFSAPSYNDLYWPGSGNPDLESEEGEMLELSLTHNFDTNHAFIPVKLNLYTGSLDNKINWADTGEIDDNGWAVYKPFNIGKVNIRGVELYMQYNATKFMFDIAGAYSESIDKSTDEQLNNVPKWSGSSNFQYNITNAIKPKLTYTYVGERTTSYSGDLKEVHLLDFAINYQVMKHINIGFNANNLTDNEQPLAAGYNPPGRTYMFTVGAQM